MYTRGVTLGEKKERKCPCGKKLSRNLLFEKYVLWRKELKKVSVYLSIYLSVLSFKGILPKYKTANKYHYKSFSKQMLPTVIQAQLTENSTVHRNERHFHVRISF